MLCYGSLVSELGGPTVHGAPTPSLGACAYAVLAGNCIPVMPQVCCPANRLGNPTAITHSSYDSSYTDNLVNAVKVSSVIAVELSSVLQ